ncbi:Uncharacterised protein [Salmonella enterica subsp. enterica serovar Typhimurium str. DT104]|nr:Uncharacterised protein [Salmonella enterica subsp. enterica serovar Typhimurium str. DT104]
MEWREEAYTLDELADYLDLSASARRSIDKHYGMGRNCHPVRNDAQMGLQGDSSGLASILTVA